MNNTWKQSLYLNRLIFSWSCSKPYIIYSHSRWWKIHSVYFRCHGDHCKIRVSFEYPLLRSFSLYIQFNYIKSTFYLAVRLDLYGRGRKINSFIECLPSKSFLRFANFFIVVVACSFNILVKSATADFVPLNSVIVEAKFLVAVSNWFECAEPFHLNLKFIEQFLILN